MDRLEAELIKKAQHGDARAFDRLVRLHDRRILQMICSIVGNLHDAYDVHQETFIRAFRKLDTFRFESELSTWLGRIAINLSINWRRRQKRRSWFSFDGDQETMLADEDRVYLTSSNDAESALANEELRLALEKGLNTLPDQQRSAFILKHIHGYKIREISEMLDSAEGTIKNHLFRATRKLQKSMKQHYSEK